MRRLVPLSLACLTLAATPATAQYGSGGHRGGRGGQNGAGQTPTTPQPAAGSERATIMIEPVGMLIATFDSNGDGRVTQAELTAGVARTFKVSDTFGSGRMGYIDYADWATRWLGDADALPSPFTVDANGDNVITLDELQAAIAHIFARFDAGKDGVVTRKELLTIHSAPNGGGFGGGARHRGGKDRGSP
ncbi:EF-hand domain-containing protein [Sphingomonas oligophenolica]|uniref:EF-hand domain-containing protein n=1 Tax=Sphingomonas oligophenolica TaxID=301154 RepID=A0A502CSP7_9SPHN|nr:EF-hand domain-containing protein [Sphingomonas oligophenolica]TPG15714.1 EF-hand domain-containing protein [Sphingomonas oligophenolica]